MSRRSRRTRTSSAGGPGADTDIDPADLERYLDKYTDSLSGDPLGLANDDTFADLSAMARTVPTAALGLVPRLFDLVLSNLDALPTAWTATINADAPLDLAKLCLSRWLDLMQQLVILAEHRSMHIQSVNQANGTGGAVAATTGRGGRAPARKRAKHVSTDEAEWDWETLKLRTFNTLHHALALPLNHDLTDAERNEAVSHVAKAVAELWQNKDRTSLKNATLKQVMYKVYAQCIVEHRFDAQVALEQNIKFFDFLAEPTAEFLAYLVRDHNHSKLASDMLVSIAKGDSLGADGGKHVKSIAIFLTSLANLVPRIVQKSLVYLQDQLDNPDYTMRIAVLHCVASTLRLLIDPALAGEAGAEGDVPAGEAGLDQEVADDDDADEDGDQPGGNRITSRVQSLLTVIEERFRDVTAQVRKKALVVVSDLVDYRYFYARFPIAWLRLVGLAVGRLLDKNQPVRAAAIRAVTQFLVRHPFTIHGTSLDPAKLQPMADEVFAQKQEMMKQLEDNPGAAYMDNKLADALHVREKYFSHALQFTNTIESKAVPALVQLLASKSKAEVLETMDFFVEAQGLDLPGGIEGLRNMWMLVFNVRNSEHVKDVHSKLVECFRAVYIVGRGVAAPPAPAEDEAGPALVGADATVRNLIKLTYSASLADLTCLEQLVGMCVKEGHIESRVVDIMWSMLESSTADRRVPAKQRRGAAIVLAWACRADSKLLGGDQVSIVYRTLRTHTRDVELARYCCQILGHLPTRLPASHHLFDPLVNALVAPAPETVDAELGDPWYSMAQQTIVTIHRICQQPLQIMDRVIRTRSNELSTSMPVPEPVLCRFFFVLGHAAIQSLVFLEAIESMYKQKQAAGSSIPPAVTRTPARTPARTPVRATPGRRMSRHSRTPAAARPGQHHSDGDEDMEGVVGSIEDVFAENMTALREFELLSRSNSLLGVFVPFVVEVVSSPITPPTVRQFATITLAQFMCVSGGFCEDHLPLLISVIQAAPPLLKSNLMIALGDLIVCWNTVIDNEVHVLYDALKSRQDPSVKKNALMVLLHLILNGMVKVKGHLSALAMCSEDKDEKIAGLTRLFLAELAGKEQALYNNLSDALSHLLMFKSSGDSPPVKDSGVAKKKKESKKLATKVVQHEDDDEDAKQEDSMDVDAQDTSDAEVDGDAETQEEDVEEEEEETADEGAVKRVLKFLFSFISKDKQVENLIEKLCARLKESEQPRQWRAITYALSLLPWDSNPEPKCRKLLENFGVFTDKLGEEAVYKSVKDVIAKATRGTTGIGTTAAATKASGAGAVPLIEELSKRVEQAREEDQE